MSSRPSLPGALPLPNTSVEDASKIKLRTKQLEPNKAFDFFKKDTLFLA
ncbi:hypothetical protein QM565_03345 [Geitlerinema splendidum]|nr:hypothetical protein [Geitlerinema splendidum]